MSEKPIRKRFQSVAEQALNDLTAEAEEFQREHGFSFDSIKSERGKQIMSFLTNEGAALQRSIDGIDGKKKPEGEKPKKTAESYIK